MAERHLTVRRRVPAPPEAVWTVCSDFPNLADHWDGLRASRPLGDRATGLGAQREVDLKPIGRLTETVTEWEDGHAIATANEPSALVPFSRAASRLVLEPDGDGTEVRFDYRYVPRGGPVGRLTGPLIDRMLTRTFESMLAAIEDGAAGRG